jgi:ComF family protein
MGIKIKGRLLDIIFPKFCLNCRREGSYLCYDCQSLIEISGFHRQYSSRNLDDLYFAADYRNFLIKKTIRCFAYEPFARELAEPLSSLIITHFQLMDNKPDFSLWPASGRKTSGFAVIPAPLHKKRLKWRGFNQAEELGKELAAFFGFPLLSNCLIKNKETLPQAVLSCQARQENVKGAFSVENRKSIENKSILLVDDIFITGATMEECAGSLKAAGARKVIGLAVARG